MEGMQASACQNRRGDGHQYDGRVKGREGCTHVLYLLHAIQMRLLVRPHSPKKTNKGREGCLAEVRLCSVPLLHWC